MAKIELRQPTVDDLKYITRHMRAADRAECIASGQDPFTAIAISAAMSTHCVAAIVDDVPACAFGIVPVSIIGGQGCIWLLGTDAVEKHRRALLRGMHGYIPQMLRAYPHVFNRVHARNETAVKWLRRVGFTLHPAEPHGPYGEDFHPFEMRA